MLRQISSKFSYLLICGAILAGSLLLAFGAIHKVFLSAINPDTKENVPFVVERNWSIRSVTENLEAQKLVKHWWSVYFLARLMKGKLPTIKAGEYALSPSMKPVEILEKFVRAEIVYHDVVIPEGSTVKDVEGLLVKTTIITPDEAHAALHNRALMMKLDVPADSFEGYLFPDTYRFTRADTPENMVTTMVEQGKRKRTKEFINRAIDLGLSLHQVIILASIIEKETGSKADRKKISSVFHNRLRLGLRLQSDPTVIYGMPQFNGNLTKEDLLTPNPYNTYIIVGLPPGPICNPGVESLEAAIYPEPADYLYFVAKGDGTSIFSSTYKEHREAVQKYQVQPNLSNNKNPAVVAPR